HIPESDSIGAAADQIFAIAREGDGPDFAEMPNKFHDRILPVANLPNAQGAVHCCDCEKAAIWGKGDRRFVVIAGSRNNQAACRRIPEFRTLFSASHDPMTIHRKGNRPAKMMVAANMLQKIARVFQMDRRYRGLKRP